MSNNVGQFGDTTMTKVFVGGLAWETPKEALRDHFDVYGEILEAVIISDKITGRSKGYGFVTFKEAEAAKKACEEATPIINGRSNVGPRSVSPAPGSHVQWYYPAGTPPSPFHHHQQIQHHQAVPFYGYTPTYIATDVSYNHKLSYTGGSYMNGQYSQVYPGQPMVGGNTLMPMYPLYHYHQSQTMGLPAHVYSPTAVGPFPTGPALISKPTSLAPTTGTVGTGEALKRVAKRT
ncbi:hypothetical protein CsSME_00000638 [Camellia sinensis var. sinensis]